MSTIPTDDKLVEKFVESFPVTTIEAPEKINPAIEKDRVLTLLRKARAKIERGWIKRTLQRRVKKESGVGWEYHYCMVGAVMSASRTNEGKGGALDLLAASIPRGRYSHDSAATIMGYNDEPNRTQNQVLAVFDRAITRRVKELSS